MNCACVFEDRQDPDFSGKPPVLIDICAFHADAERKARVAERAKYEEVLEDKRRLTRELDVALSGESGAAKQASLCDLIPIAKALRAKAESAAAAEREAVMKIVHRHVHSGHFMRVEAAVKKDVEARAKANARTI